MNFLKIFETLVSAVHSKMRGLASIDSKLRRPSDLSSFDSALNGPVSRHMGLRDSYFSLAIRIDGASLPR